MSRDPRQELDLGPEPVYLSTPDYPEVSKINGFGYTIDIPLADGGRLFLNIGDEGRKVLLHVLSEMNDWEQERNGEQVAVSEAHVVSGASAKPAYKFPRFLFFWRLVIVVVLSMVARGCLSWTWQNSIYYGFGIVGASWFVEEIIWWLLAKIAAKRGAK